MSTASAPAFHVAVDHVDQETLEVATTYLGTCDQAHVDEVRAIAGLEGATRFVKEHPRQAGSFFVLRDDGDLDKYVPVDAPEFRIYEPDPTPKGVAERVRKAAGQAERGETKDLGDFAQYLTDEAPEPPRGASSGPSYISGVTRLGDQSIGGAMDTPGNPARAVWHTTESPAGGGYFTSVGAYLINVASEPQVIYDPVTDRLGQYGPLNQSGRALQNDGSRRTNREGRVCIQVEVLGRAADPWTKGFDPAKKPNYRALIAAMRAWGIADTWPAGKPVAKSSASMPRTRATWQSKGGHYGHCHVPGNSHWDPGAIDTALVPGKASTPVTPAKPAAQYEPFPGASFFHTGRHSAIITAMGRRLVAEGCGKYHSGPGPDFTNSDKASYAAWQRKLGYTGAAADGIPGKTSWDKLHVLKGL